jgi:hypothetical protein
VCRFHGAAGAGSAPCQKLVSNNLQNWFLSPTGRLNLLLCSSHLPLGGPNWSVNTAPSTSFLAPLLGIEEEEAPTSTTRHQSSFLAPLPGRKRISVRGVSHFQSFCFVIVLLSFFTLFCLLLVYQKYKKLVPSIVVIFVGLLLSCFIMLSINGWFL